MTREPIRIGIAGLGNCASSLLQGLEFYRDASANDVPPGLMHVELGGYHVRDVRLASAFDIHAGKVGKDAAAAIFVPPNNTLRFAEPPPSGVQVRRGPVLDGIGAYMQEDIPVADVPEVDVADELRKSETQILISYLPVGSQQASEFYAEQALQAGCAYINCIPVFLASNRIWAKRFADKGLPIIGDDIKSQVGATIVHRTLARLMRERGIHLDRTYQLNFGGNADFRNMLERERLVSKKISKTRAVTSELETPLLPENVHIGPSDHIPWLTDRKWAHIRLEGTGFGGSPFNMEVKLEVWDSPNSAGIVIDAIRCARLALDRALGGPLAAPSAYFMKSPPEQCSDAEARRRTKLFIDGIDDIAR
jgi:myo-inositol-1-phosphate synthase